MERDVVIFSRAMIGRLTLKSRLEKAGYNVCAAETKDSSVNELSRLAIVRADAKEEFAVSWPDRDGPLANCPVIFVGPESLWIEAYDRGACAVLAPDVDELTLLATMRSCIMRNNDEGAAMPMLGAQPLPRFNLCCVLSERWPIGPWRRALPDVGGTFHVKSTAELLAARDLHKIDVFLVSVDTDDLAKDLRVISEIRARSPTRDAGLLVVTSQPGKISALALDLGADDVIAVSNGREPDPLLLQRKVQRIIARMALKAEKQAIQRRHEHLAQRDALTGLYNRHFALPEMDKMLKSRDDLSVVMIDVDHFKSINDDYGHDVGDRVLIEIAGVLEHCVKEGEICARLGGEEFLMVLRSTSPAEAARRVDTVLTHIAQLHETRAASAAPLSKVTASAGIASRHRATPYTTTDRSAIMRAADQALIAAKRRGRDCIVFSNETSAA